MNYDIFILNILFLPTIKNMENSSFLNIKKLIIPFLLLGNLTSAMNNNQTMSISQNITSYNYPHDLYENTSVSVQDTNYLTYDENALNNAIDNQLDLIATTSGKYLADIGYEMSSVPNEGILSIGAPSGNILSTERNQNERVKAISDAYISDPIVTLQKTISQNIEKIRKSVQDIDDIDVKDKSLTQILDIANTFGKTYTEMMSDEKYHTREGKSVAGTDYVYKPIVNTDRQSFTDAVRSYLGYGDENNQVQDKTVDLVKIYSENGEHMSNFRRLQDTIGELENKVI